MICPRCGVQANGRFCASCGARLQQPCAQCGAPLQPDDKFCGECGTQVAVPQDSSSAGNSRSSSVTIGDIGVMRGTIDQSTHAHTTIGSQMNVTGDLNVRLEGTSKPTYTELMARGRQALASKLYQSAIDSFNHAVQMDNKQSDAYFYLALATLQGKRPKLVSLTTARTVEQLLQSAVNCDERCAHAYLLWALIKDDAYAQNGITQHAPTSAELLRNAGSVDEGKLADILKHLNAPGNRIWEKLRK